MSAAGRSRRDDGAAPVLMVARAGVLMFVAAGLAAVGGLVTAQRQAQTAADLAALGGADDPATGCDAAARVAAANAASLDRCRVVGREVTVTVSVPGPRVPWRDVRVSAEARAGPV